MNAPVAAEDAGITIVVEAPSDPAVPVTVTPSVIASEPTLFSVAERPSVCPALLVSD